jgi:hypothetical protein
MIMKSEFNKGKPVSYAKTLAAAAILLGALTFLKMAGFLAASSEVRLMAARVGDSAPDVGASADVGKLLASGRASADELKKKNLFVKTPPRQHPVREVLGILGDEALINGKWCKVGDSVGDAKIVAIEPTRVKIAWDGQEKDFSPIGSGGGGQAPERPGASRPRAGSEGRAPVVANNARNGPSPTEQAGPQLSEEEREKMRSRFQNMTPEERQQARQQMRQELSRRAQ